MDGTVGKECVRVAHTSPHISSHLLLPPSHFNTLLHTSHAFFYAFLHLPHTYPNSPHSLTPLPALFHRVSDLTSPVIEHKTSRTDSARLTTELTSR